MWRLIGLALVALLAGCGGQRGHSQAFHVTVEPSVGYEEEVAGTPLSSAAQVGTTIAVPLGVREITVAAPAGHRVSAAYGQAQQPSRPKGDAIADADSNGASAQAPAADNPLASLAGSFWYMIAGAVIAIAGGVIMVAKRGGAVWAVAIPKGAGLVLIIGGAGMAVLPYFLERYGWMIAAGVACLALPWLLRYGYNVFNRKDKAEANEQRATD